MMIFWKNHPPVALSTELEAQVEPSSSLPEQQLQSEEVELSADAPDVQDVRNEGDDGKILLGRGMRTRTPSVRLRDFVVNTILPSTTTSLSALIQSHSSGPGNSYSLSQFLDSSRFSMDHRCFPAITAGTEPKSFKKAVKDPGWREAMQREIQALKSNKTWTLEPLPDGKKALRSQWI